MLKPLHLHNWQARITSCDCLHTTYLSSLPYDLSMCGRACHCRNTSWFNILHTCNNKIDVNSWLLLLRTRQLVARKGLGVWCIWCNIISNVSSLYSLPREQFCFHISICGNIFRRTTLIFVKTLHQDIVV